MNPVVKKILNIALDVVIAILVVFAVLISMVAISSNANNNVPNVFGVTPFSVQSDSMEPTFNVGDYIFVKACDSKAAAQLQSGDVISFFALDENGKRFINTHRIVSVVQSDSSVLYETKGDNPKYGVDDVLVSSSDVIGKFTGTKIPFLGRVMDFLSTKWGFFCIVLLPILAFTVYQIYRLIATVLYNKKVEMAQDVAENASDDVKEAIIAAYLAQQEEDAQPSEEQDKISE